VRANESVNPIERPSMSPRSDVVVNSDWLSPASWWVPEHFPLSAWVRHAPFAFWIVDRLRPRSIVELGTHWGFSYFAFCEAVKRLGLSSRTFALDTWVGEEHAGHYGEEVFDYVNGTNAAEYADFSTLLRGYFDDSLDDVEDGSVDLLHIDGRHGLEDVRHDFFSWLPKLTDRAVVLFHDIAERQDGFGVWQFWEEVSQNFPSFTFEHEHGLGVLGVGSHQTDEMSAFFTAGAVDGDRIRADYERLGDTVATIGRWSELPAELDAERLDKAIQVKKRDDEIIGLHNQLDTLHSSTSWKATKPLRAATDLFRKR
jgi:hypothetical protein